MNWTVVRETYQWYLVHRNSFEMLGLLLAVIGTIFAVLSIQDGRKLTRDLRSIFDHLTTKEVGSYPAYMSEVERIISEARESIFIATDFPGHGVWTDRGRYGSYVKGLGNRKAECVPRRQPPHIPLLGPHPHAPPRAPHHPLPQSPRQHNPTPLCPH